jgi:hypothetical protein
MIVDCFLFGWELDLLECRLRELEDVVDIFVLCEAKQTFQGDAKPLYYNDNKTRFDHWSHKIRHVIADLPVTDNPWEREYAQRDAMLAALQDLPDSAIVLNGDVDEIPFPTTVGAMTATDPWVIDYTFYSMAVNWQLPYNIPCTIVATKADTMQTGMAGMRWRRVGLPSHPGGWHFTWLGGAQMIAQKAASFSHTESSVQDYVRSMGGRLYGEGYHVLGEKLIPVDVDDSFPSFIRNRECPEIWFRPGTFS